MLKHVTAIMVVLVTLVVFLPMETVGLYYYFILDLGVTAIPSLMVSILSLHNHGQKLSMKVMVLFCYSLQIKRMKNKEGQLYRSFLDRQRGIVFALFAGTFSRFLEPQFVDINTKIDGRKSSFSVPGLVNVEVESFKNPVTGEEQDTKIQLPKGLVWKIADAAKSKIMRITSPDLNFDHSGKNAFYSVVEFKGP